MNNLHKGQILEIDDPAKANYSGAVDFKILNVFKNHILCVSPFGTKECFTRGELIELNVIQDDDIRKSDWIKKPTYEKVKRKACRLK